MTRLSGTDSDIGDVAVEESSHAFQATFPALLPARGSLPPSVTGGTASAHGCWRKGRVCFGSPKEKGGKQIVVAQGRQVGKAVEGPEDLYHGLWARPALRHSSHFEALSLFPFSRRLSKFALSSALLGGLFLYCTSENDRSVLILTIFH